MTSSPSNGLETEREGWVAKNVFDLHYGDSIFKRISVMLENASAVHYYNYNIDGWSPNLFPVPRFASEFGRQSWYVLMI